MQKWEWELKKGNIWRAKEILRGHIAQIYQPDEYIAYGKLLYDLKDYYEAGKYLFAGGAEIDGKYKDAIYVFLERNNSVHLHEFMSRFPLNFARTSYEMLPTSVKTYIESHFSSEERETLKKENTIIYPATPTRIVCFLKKVKSRLYFIFWFAVTVFFTISFFVGIYTTLNYIFEEKNSEREYCINICKFAPSESLQECIEKEHALIKRLDPSIQKTDYSKSH